MEGSTYMTEETTIKPTNVQSANDTNIQFATNDVLECRAEINIRQEKLCNSKCVPRTSKQFSSCCSFIQDLF
jgi:hypothetical protein